MSAEASVSVIISPGKRTIQVHRIPESSDWISGLIGNDDMRGVRQPDDYSAEIRSGLVRYLGVLRKELTAFIYRRDGEKGKSLRELTVQILMNQVLLTRMKACHHQPVDTCGCTLTGRLISYAVSSPVHDRYDLRIPDSSREEAQDIVNRLAFDDSPMLSGTRISWIRSGTWASVFREYEASIPRTHSRKQGAQIPDDAMDPDTTLNSGIGMYVTGILPAILRHTNNSRIYDPESGCGEVIARILDLHRINRVAEGKTDTVISRLIDAAELIHASDPSPIHIAMVRFIMVISIIGVDFRDPSLSSPPLWYPFNALTKQIRAGNMIFHQDITDEFFSRDAGYPVLRRLHPLDAEELVSPGKVWSLVLSSPSGKYETGYQEVISYLTRKYQSFQQGIHPSALIAEQLYDHLTPEGNCILFLPASWLSEDSFRGFRRWVSHHLPATIIVREENSGGIGRTGFSALLVHRGGDPELKVVRFQGSDGKKTQLQEFSLDTDQLPDADGWTLQDPWEEAILRRLGSGLMPLSGYLLDEIYPVGKEGHYTGHADEWISVILNDTSLQVHQGNKPDPGATAIIPGRDPYLTGLLTSSLIQWFMQVRQTGPGYDYSELNRIRGIPIRAIDEYNPDECLIRNTIEQYVTRITMLSRLCGKHRPWHDRERINRQIAQVQKDLDLAVCRLYGLSPDDCRKIRGLITQY